MKKITHHFGADLQWINEYSKQFGGKVEGNFMIFPESISTGTRYILECEPGIVAYYADVTYNIDLMFAQENKTNNFISLYYNLSEGDLKLTSPVFSCCIGRWLHNMIVIDSSVKSQYYIKKGSKTLALCIFIKKEIIKSHFKTNHTLYEKIEYLTSSESESYIKTYRMDDESIHALYNLRKINIHGNLFNLNLIGTVNLLLYDYLKKICDEKEILEVINKIDLSQILLSQRFLLENIEMTYPGNDLIAQNANMSKSKFIRLYKLINNDTPGNFFVRNKLIKAKELLQENSLSVSQIAEKLHLNNSHFCSIFKSFFGISPKTFIKQIQKYDSN